MQTQVLAYCNFFTFGVSALKLLLIAKYFVSLCLERKIACLVVLFIFILLPSVFRGILWRYIFSNEALGIY